MVKKVKGSLIMSESRLLSREIFPGGLLTTLSMDVVKNIAGLRTGAYVVPHF